jgi:predicted metal-dependent enzyme (double-stranded beta helix superfamily)
MIEQKYQQFEHFLESLQEQVAPCADDPEKQMQITADLLAKLLASRPPLDERYMVGNPDHYARHKVYVDPQDRYCVVAMVWNPGQQTAIHDHDGVWCVEGVYQGCMQITRYNLKARSGHTYRFEQDEVFKAGCGEVGHLIPPSEYHKMENIFDTPAVSIHVYGQELKSCSRYLPAEDGVHHISQRVELRYDP